VACHKDLTMMSSVASRQLLHLARRRAPTALASFQLPSDIVSVTTTLNQRWFSRKAARMGQHLDSLKEQAHRGSREEAKEKRQQKKKGKKGEEITEGGDGPSASQSEIEDIVFDDDEEEKPSEEEGPSLPDPDEVKAKMLKVVDRLKESYKSIRGAEPSPELFDSIMVSAYDDRAPLSSVAQVVIASPTLAHVTCFDPALAKDVLNAIRDSLELNPQLEEDGVVKVPLPRPSAETRQRTVKQLGKQAEATRARIRKMRRKAQDKVKLGKDGKMEGISKDDAFRVAKEIDAVVDEVTKLINDAVQEKEESVMAV
jgi:ribosome recycling factor